MCMIRSKRNGCLQGTLVFLLVLCVLLFGTIAVIHLAVYFITADSTNLEIARQKRHVDSNNFINLPMPRHRRFLSTDSSFADQVAELFFSRQCPHNEWIVQSGRFLELCSQSELPIVSMNNMQFNKCLRDSYFYIGLAALIPFGLTLFSLIVVCRQCLCPIISLAIIYLGLALALILGVIFYKSGAIITDVLPLFILIIAIVCLYALLSLLLIWLFALATCERKHSNGDNENIIKMSDEDDEIDDPNVPLYKNGLYSPQKRTDFDDKIKDFKYIDDDMSYVFRRG